MPVLKCNFWSILSTDFFKKMLEKAVWKQKLEGFSLSESTRVDEFLNTPNFNEKIHFLLSSALGLWGYHC